MSASSITIKAFEPPNSNICGFKLAAAILVALLPAASLPVNESPAIIGLEITADNRDERILIT